MINRRNCPICDKALSEDPVVLEKLFPFCSVRCRQIDLFRWAEGRYAVVEKLDPNVAQLLSEEFEDGAE